MKFLTGMRPLILILIAGWHFSTLFAMNTQTDQTSSIREVITSLFRHSDQRNWSKVEEAFADEVRLDYTSLAGGEPQVLSPAEITSQWCQVLPGFDYTFHAIGNFDIEVYGHQACAHHAGSATHYLSGVSDGAIWVAAGTYDYQLICEEGHWKVKEMTFRLEYMDGNENLPRLASEKVAQTTGKEILLSTDNPVR